MSSLDHEHSFEDFVQAIADVVQSIRSGAPGDDLGHARVRQLPPTE